MTAPRLYDVVFSGELLAGSDPAEARRRLAALFKSDAAAIERLFSGQPVAIKKGVNEGTAARYREAFRQAGAACQICVVPVAVAAPPPERVAQSMPQSIAPESAASALAGSLGGVTILPAGTLLPQPELVEPPQYDLRGFTLAEIGVDLASPRQIKARPIPDISAITLAPVGIDLIKGE
jgi:hypothetical protein